MLPITNTTESHESRGQCQAFANCNLIYMEFVTATADETLSIDSTNTEMRKMQYIDRCIKYWWMTHGPAGIEHQAICTEYYDQMKF